MELEVRLFGSFRQYVSKPAGLEHIHLPAPATARDLLEALPIPPKYHSLVIVFRNGKRVSLSTEMEDGDRIGIMPPMGGG
ncbi:MAG TPA: MoaD/ThiS family protein [Firmicutes bacterium]|nr:MoaD/ThiS family protein [Bacillota bacterium]